MTTFIEFDEQPISDHLAEACEWLSAVERHDCDPYDETDIQVSLTAGEALDVLRDVQPPYPPLGEIYPPTAFSDAAPAALAALGRAIAMEAIGVRERLRIATAVRVLTKAQRRLSDEHGSR